MSWWASSTGWGELVGLVAEYETAGWFTANAATVSVTCAEGDVLVASAVCGNQLRDLAISGGGLTWTLKGSVRATARCSIAQWTAAVGAGQAGTFDVTATFSESGAGGLNVLRYDGIDSVGAHAVADATGPAAPTLDLTSTATDSVVVVVVGDHATVDGSGRAWDTADAGALTEQTYFLSVNENAAYVGWHPAAGAAGVKAVGLTAPATMRYSIAAVELLIEQASESGGSGLRSKEITAALVSKVAALGVFEGVNTGQPRHMAGNGLRCALWLDRIEGYAGGSGLNSVSVRLALALRVYGNVQQEPSDEIDPEILAAVDAVCNAFAADLDLDGEVRNVDVFGAAGQNMFAQAAYQEVQDGVCRVVTINLPLIVNDVWMLEA